MSITALIVDDSATARQIISYHLHHAGCTIIGEAANATIALKLFREHKPAVVTLDLMMPRVLNVDSMALLRTMKREMPEVAIIVVSVIAFEKTRNDFLDQGVLAYVHKPLNDFNFDPVRIKLRRVFPELVAAQFQE
ncbi:MAG TPA: response regulator [Candidatus Binataceae bacterium]|jgi:two-component system chemotaxis response regulator CheY|nr:response regulator [Candidatus Binataceae bacterium]